MLAQSSCPLVWAQKWGASPYWLLRVQEELARGEDIAHCPSYSLTVVVIYNQVPGVIVHICGSYCLLLFVDTAHPLCTRLPNGADCSKAEYKL